MKKPKGPKVSAKSKPAPKDDGGEISPGKKLKANAKAQAEPEAKPEPEAQAEPEVQAEPEAQANPEAQAEPEAADAPVPDTARLDDAPPEDLPPEDPPHIGLPHNDQAHDEEHGSRSLAATALMILIGVIFIASLTLWAAPKLAPHLPGSMAKYLLPGQIDTEGRLAGLDDAIAAEAAKSEAAIASLNDGIAALASRLDASAETGQTEAAIAAAQLTADTAAGEAATLAARLDAIDSRLTALDSRLTALGNEFSALSTALANAASGEGVAPPEIAAAIAALSARLDSLAASIEGGGTAAQALETRISALGVRLDAAESSAADARDAQSEALGEASSTVRQAQLQAALDLLSSRLTGGLPYAVKLGEVAALAASPPPAPLTAGADTGLATAADLEAGFGRHAHAAVAADVQAGTGEDGGLGLLGWLRAQVAGRPVAETEGDSAGAITSRIAARVGEGKLAQALTEAETLSEPAQAGLAGWLDQLRARVAADMALADWRAQIGAGG